jgi:hypothetical protein
VSDAVKLARWCMWSDADDPDVPEPSLPNLDFIDPDVGMSLLARHVLAQDEELAKLRAIAWTCTRCGRSDLDVGTAAKHRASCMSRTDDEQCIDELRAALAEALRYLDDQPSAGTAADVARIAELRRLL